MTTRLLNQTRLINQVVKLDDIIMPEFGASLHVMLAFRAYVAEAQATSFDMILGQDYNIWLRADVINSKRVVTWMGHEVPFRVMPHSNQRFREMQQAYIASFSPKEEQYSPNHCGIAEILAAKYDVANVDEVADAQTYLTLLQRKQLKHLFRQFLKLFSGKLGCYPHRKIHLDVVDNAKPVCKKPYPVVEVYKKLFKDELDCLCSLGVLKKVGASEWALPTFILPKKIILSDGCQT